MFAPAEISLFIVGEESRSCLKRIKSVLRRSSDPLCDPGVLKRPDVPKCQLGASGSKHSRFICRGLFTEESGSDPIAAEVKCG